MKTLTYRIALALSIAIFCLPAHALAATTHSRSIGRALQDSKKTQDELYATFKKGLTGDANAKKAANEAGKEFVQKDPEGKDPRTKEIKEWMTTYAADMQGIEVLVNVYKAKKYDDAFQIGKQVLVADPDNIKILTALGYAGMPAAAAGDSRFTADAISYAKKAIQLIGSGKAPIDWKPFSGKDETLGWLNYSLGVMVLRTAPSESIGYLVKAGQFEGAPKKDPVVYYYLAVLYGQDFEKQRTAYKATYEGKPETPESKVALEKVSSVVDLIIDAYARAISCTDASPQLKQTYQTQEIDWTKKVTELYKSRHNGSDSGLKEMIATIQLKPMPGQQTSLAPMTLP
jgi:hypothetical protein